MGIISSLVRLGLVAGISVTAYQASEKTKQEAAGKLKTDDFIRNFKEQAAVNYKIVADAVKEKLGTADSSYRYSDEGENGYTYVDTEPAEDKVDEVFENMKEKAPEVIGKVQDLVDDLREKAPGYVEKAQDIVGSVKEAAKKVIDKKDDE